MDRIVGIIGCPEISLKPETLFYYAALAVLVTVLVNWTLATVLMLLRPFTCAAIMMAFIRPDLVEKLVQEENLLIISETVKDFFLTFTKILLRFGEQFRAKLN